MGGARNLENMFPVAPMVSHVGHPLAQTDSGIGHPVKFRNNTPQKNKVFNHNIVPLVRAPGAPEVVQQRPHDQGGMQNETAEDNIR